MYNKQLAKEWEEKGYQRGLEGICITPPGFYLLPAYLRYSFKVGVSKGLTDLRKKTMEEANASK